MSIDNNFSNSLQFQPFTKERWSDFEDLFGKRGAYGGCWCMWWRLTRKEFEQGQGEGNRIAMKAIVDSGQVPGILAYHQGKTVAWCSLAPREQFASLERSRVLKRIDDTPVWSIVCFFVAKAFRKQGITLQLIQGAIKYVKEQGGKIIESYPTQTRGKELPPVSSYMGMPEVFAKAGFKEVSKPSPSKIIMRYYIK